MTSPHAIPCLTRPGRDTCQRCCRAAMTPEASRRPNPATHLLADSLTDLLTDLLTYWMTDLTICGKASRARRKKSRAMAFRHMAPRPSQTACWNSQLSRQQKSACAPGKVGSRVASREHFLTISGLADLDFRVATEAQRHRGCTEKSKFCSVEPLCLCASVVNLPGRGATIAKRVTLVSIVSPLQEPTCLIDCLRLAAPSR